MIILINGFAEVLGVIQRFMGEETSFKWEYSSVYKGHLITFDLNMVETHQLLLGLIFIVVSDE